MHTNNIVAIAIAAALVVATILTQAIGDQGRHAIVALNGGATRKGKSTLGHLSAHVFFHVFVASVHVVLSIVALLSIVVPIVLISIVVVLQGSQGRSFGLDCRAGEDRQERSSNFHDDDDNDGRYD